MHDYITANREIDHKVRILDKQSSCNPHHLTMSSSLPPNVRVSSHPLLQTKLSLLRSTGTPSIVTRSLTEYDSLVHPSCQLSQAVFALGK